jgi:hypothetical protein
MSNPTTPFSWQMPTATDLVTDLPADFEVFGQAVATSMADLLGGTSGQVLAKNSNTDMDFVWVTSDDANAIQNTIVDAKGDLIAATAADTPARLAIGGDYGFLQALASESTGLKWNSGVWTSYTPTLQSITLGNGTIVGKYIRIGKFCSVRIQLTLGSTSSVSTFPRFSIPFQAFAMNGAQIGSCTFQDFGTDFYWGTTVFEDQNNVQVYAMSTS